MKKTHFLFAAGLAVLLQGCQTLESHRQIVSETKEKAEIIRETHNGITFQKPSVATQSDAFWVNKSVVRVKTESSIPESFNKELFVTVNPRASVTDIVAILTKLRPDVKFIISPEVFRETNAALMMNGYVHQGSLTALLDSVTNRAGVFWKTTPGNNVVIYAVETRDFRVFQPPGNIEFESTIGAKNQTTSTASAASSTGGTGGTSTTADSIHSTKMSGGKNNNFWNDLKETLTPMLTPQKGKLFVAEGSGLVTVTDTPQVLAAVDAMINSINDIRRRQVALNIKIYSVKTNDNNKLGLDMGLVYETLTSKYAISLTGGAGATTGLGALTGIITNPNSSWDTSRAIAGALGQQGDVTLMTEITLTTKSGVAASVNSTQELVYSSDISTVATTNAGVTQGVISSKLVTGLSGQLIPQIIDGRTLHLSAVFDLSSLDRMGKVTVNNVQLDRPEVSRRSFVESVEMKSGQTLMISGLQQFGNTTSNGGTLGPDNLWAGGSLSSTRDRNTLVIIITPYITSGKRG